MIYSVEQKSEEWLSLRLGKFTASDAQSIQSNGKGLETLCFEKVAEILTGKGKPSFTNEDIERGNEMEETAREIYEFQSGNSVVVIGFVESNEYVGCSPDGFVGDDGLVEIKCKNDVNFVRYMFDEKIDPAHYWQMQMQMLVTGRKWCDYVVFNENFATNIIIVRVNREEADIKSIQNGLDCGIETVKKIINKVSGK